MTDNRFKAIISRISGSVFTRQTGIFLIFIVISALLWLVSALNEVVQRQIDCKVELVNVPDSIMFINDPPSEISIGVVGRGTHIIREWFGSKPVIEIDFNAFKRSGNRMVVSKSEMLELAQQALGDERQIQNVYPDTIGVYYTSSAPERLAVRLEATATAAPNLHILYPLLLMEDSVWVYSVPGASAGLRYVPTAAVAFEGIDRSTVCRVPLVVPRGCRAVPDSVGVKIVVEPFVTQTRSYAVEVVNAPGNVDVSVFPEEVKAVFRVPRSMQYNIPDIRMTVDYGSIDFDGGDNRVAVSPEPWEPYMFLDTDSVSVTVRHHVYD